MTPMQYHQTQTRTIDTTVLSQSEHVDNKPETWLRRVFHENFHQSIPYNENGLAAHPPPRTCRGPDMKPETEHVKIATVRFATTKVFYPTFPCLRACSTLNNLPKKNTEDNISNMPCAMQKKTSSKNHDRRTLLQISKLARSD